MKLRPLAIYAWGVLAFNVLVILWGAFVRISHSGDGCGKHWPLCNGAVIPHVSHTEAWIEFTHRATSGIALLLVVGLLIWVWRAAPPTHQLRQGALVAMGFMLVEVLVGAVLVVLGLVAGNTSIERAIVITIHQANTFMLLGALTITAWLASGGAALQLRGQGSSAWLLGLSLLGALALGMTGATTALADTLFLPSSPGANAAVDVEATSHFLVQLRILHPIVAVLVGGLLLGVGWQLRRQRPTPMVMALTSLLFMLFVLQLAIGALNVVWLVPLWSRLTHLLLADAVWVTLVLLTAATLTQTAPQSQAIALDAPASAPRAG